MFDSPVNVIFYKVLWVKIVAISILKNYSKNIGVFAKTILLIISGY
jgi:hypothetical protein